MQVLPQPSLKNLTQEEELVYRLVVEAQRRGIKSGDIARKSGMNTAAVTKILNRLHIHDFIQTHKKPDQKSVKLWFDITVQPEQDLKGTSIFMKTNGQINEQLIENLCQRVIDFVQQQPSQMASIQEIGLTLKAVAGDLQMPDILKIVDILVYDLNLEPYADKYKLNQFAQNSQPIVINNIPCGSCPVFNLCRPGQAISPENCIYFQDW